jgi:hypothetical protein
VIRRVCFPLDATDILQIKIGEGVGEDFWVLNLTKSGVFMVRSTYRHARDANKSANEESNTSEELVNRHKGWLRQWDVSTQHKYKVHA